MNYVPQPQEEIPGDYFQPGTFPGAIETHVLVSFLWLVFCKGTVINVTLILKRAVHKKYRTSRIVYNRINGII